MEWSDLKPGDVLAFTPDFISWAGVELDWFTMDVIKIKPPIHFPIREIVKHKHSIRLCFYWEGEYWYIDYDGMLNGTSSPRVFDIIELKEDE